MTLQQLFITATEYGINLDLRKGIFPNPPFPDSMIYTDFTYNKEIQHLLVGIDIEGPELITAKLGGYDVVLAHHPEGTAYAALHEVMDIQVDMAQKSGVSHLKAECLTSEAISEIQRRIHAANHQRAVDIAKLLNISFFNLHTPADNCAQHFLTNLIRKSKPTRLINIISLLDNIPEYRHASEKANEPIIANGKNNSRCGKIHIEFTGGTEGSKDMYKELKKAGVKTVICMHQSEEHVKACKKEGINVIFASHIASDNLGVNLLLDHVIKRLGKVEITAIGGFYRVSRL